MNALGIPGVINNFNLYNDGTVLVGLTGEISLPDFEGMTETLSGPGILGEIEEVIIGTVRKHGVGDSVPNSR